jgi:hypothetical protein
MNSLQVGKYRPRVLAYSLQKRSISACILVTSLAFVVYVAMPPETES